MPDHPLLENQWITYIHIIRKPPQETRKISYSYQTIIGHALLTQCMAQLSYRFYIQLFFRPGTEQVWSAILFVAPLHRQKAVRRVSESTRQDLVP